MTGKLEVEPYSSKETPMIMYLNTHAALEQLRQKAEQDQVRPLFDLARLADFYKLAKVRQC